MSYPPRLVIKAVTYNGASINNAAMLCEFGAGEQITLGRSAGNHLVLDDPSRLVSRVQASLLYKDESSALINNISNSTGIFIGETALQPGASAVISFSDTLIIGAYILTLQRSTASHNEQPVAMPEVKTSTGFTDAKNFIPVDFDFFSVEKPLEKKVDFSSFADIAEDAGANSLLGDNLDSLRNDRSFLNHHEEVPCDRLLQEESSDPLALLSAGDKVSAVATHNLDDGNEINSLFVVPRVTNQAGSNHHGINSIESIPPVIALTNNRTTKQAPAGRQSTNTGVSAGLSDVHRQAFARGLQIDEGKLPEFTPAFFELLGGALLHLTAGAVNMMHERAHIKHELRADVTIIASSGNNPLKFAPDAQSALMHLIGEQVPGFMHSVEAIDDAFDDLLAHQIGLMSGARAAIYDVVKNFSPGKIQKYLVNKNVVDSLLPMSKRSKLWELYEAHYAEVAGNAREDFELRFQQAFSQAYEQEIDRMCEARERA